MQAAYLKATKAHARQLKIEEEFTNAIAGGGKALTERTAALLKSIAAIERTGEVSELVSSRIKEHIEVQVDGWGDRVPAALQAAAARYGALAEAQREALKEQTKAQEEATKAAEVAAAAAERDSQKIAKTYADMAESVGDSFDKLKGLLAPKDNGDAAKALRELQAEYDELQGKATRSVEELNRLNELEGLIAGKQRDVAGAITQAFEGARVEVAEAFDRMILGNDKLIEGLSLLPPASQEAFARLAQGFRDTAEAGHATQSELEAFGFSVANIFEQAGINVAGLKAELTGLATLATELKAKIADAAGVREQTGKPGGGEQEKQQAQAVQLQSQAQAELGSTLKATAPAAERLSGSIEELREEYISLQQHMKAGGTTFEQQEHNYQRLFDIGGELTARIKEMAAAVQPAAQSFDQLESPLAGAAEAMEKARYESEFVGPVLTVVGDSAAKAGDGLAEMAAQFPQLGRASTDVQQSLGKQGDAIAGLAQRQTSFNADVSQGAAAMGQFGDAAAGTAEAVGKTADELARLKESNPVAYTDEMTKALERQVAAVDKIAASWKLVRAEIAILNDGDHLQESLRLAQELKQCIAEAAG